MMRELAELLANWLGQTEYAAQELDQIKDAISGLNDRVDGLENAAKEETKIAGALRSRGVMYPGDSAESAGVASPREKPLDSGVLGREMMYLVLLKEIERRVKMESCDSAPLNRRILELTQQAAVVRLHETGQK